MHLARATPGLKTDLRQLDEFRKEAARQSKYPAGHYYSTIPDWSNAHSRVDDKLDDIAFPGIDLNEKRQLELLTAFAGALPAGFWKEGKTLVGPRYQWPNNFFHWTDANLLAHIIRHFRPKRIIEVGCGFSSAVVSDALAKGNIDLPGGRMLIDPSLARLRTLIPPDEISRLTLIEDVVQSVGVKEFLTLAEGDILFIDSAHVTKHGSDVNYLIFEVVPRLARGVVVHIHDIYVPFDYPGDWYRDKRGWNEAFLIRAFLQFNADFEVLAFADFLRRRWPDEFAAAVGGTAGEVLHMEAAPYGSLWLQRKKAVTSESTRLVAAQ